MNLNKEKYYRILIFNIVLSMLFSNNIFPQKVIDRKLIKKSTVYPIADIKIQDLAVQLKQLKEQQYREPGKYELIQNSTIMGFKDDLTSISEYVEILAYDQQSYTELESQLLQNLIDIKESLTDLVKQLESEQESFDSEKTTEARPQVNLQNFIDELEISSFFDLQNTYNLSSSENEGLNYGQFEVGIAKQINSFVSVEGAITYNSEDRLFELGAGFIDFQVLGDDGQHPIKDEFLKNLSIIFGQFDVPFGIDYLFIPSHVRKLISSPLINEKSINGMNDFGAIINGRTELIDFSFFGINGSTEKGVAIGGRIGIHPVEFVEVGSSYMTDLDKMDEAASKVFGVDLRIYRGTFEFRSEYILSGGMINGEIDEKGISNKHAGYYIQATNDFESIFSIPLFISLRLGAWKTDFKERETNNSVFRITSAVGYAVNDYLEGRIEFVSERYDNKQRINYLTAQLVVQF